MLTVSSFPCNQWSISCNFFLISVNWQPKAFMLGSFVNIFFSAVHVMVKSLIFIRNIKGTRIDPCGTPHLIVFFRIRRDTSNFNTLTIVDLILSVSSTNASIILCFDLNPIFFLYIKGKFDYTLLFCVSCSIQKVKRYACICFHPMENYVYEWELFSLDEKRK